MGKRPAWPHYLIFAFCIIGALCTWSRWCWLQNGFWEAPVALGLHFFEGWLVFIFLGLTACFSVLPLRNGPSAIACLIGGASSLMLVLIFMIRTGFDQAANAAWFSLTSSVVVVVVSLWLKIKTRQRRETA